MRLPRALVLAYATLVACAGIKAKSDYDPETDFTSYSTFAMVAPPVDAPREMPGYSELRGRALNLHIANHLIARGLTEVAEEEADLLVGFQLAGEQRSEVRTRPDTTAGGSRRRSALRWNERGSYTVDYVEGTFVVDVFDRQEDRLVWEGWSTVSLYSGTEPGAKRDEIIAAVMALFPPEE